MPAREESVEFKIGDKVVAFNGREPEWRECEVLYWITSAISGVRYYTIENKKSRTATVTANEIALLLPLGSIPPELDREFAIWK